MLDTDAREDRYRRQNGSDRRLTPKQRRRSEKKWKSRSPIAVQARAAAHSQRMAVNAARKESRLRGMLSGS